MAKFTLTDFASAVEKKYAPMEIELGEGSSITLENPVRMSKAKREKLGVLLADISEDAEAAQDGSEEPELTEEQVFQSMYDIIALASSAAAVKRLKAGIGDDPLVLMEIVTTWVKETGLGEALPSPQN